MALTLRPYQEQLVAGALDEWTRVRRTAIVMATGGGKTPTGMRIAKLSLDAGKPVLWLAHRTELVDQAIDKAEQVAPGTRIGRLQGTVKQYRAEIVVGSVQTASTPTSLKLLKSRSWGLIIVDETHHIAAETYQRVLRELGAFEPDGPLTLGITATLDRADGLALGDTFESVVNPQIGLIDLIRHPDGPYLVPPKGVRVRLADLDLGKVRRLGGDFNPGHLGAAMSAAMAPQRIVEAWQEHAKGLPTVAFLPTLAVSREQAEAFNEAGYVARHIDGETPADERRQILNDFRAGKITILCNVGLFTEGTDLPSIGCVILGRPTSSATLYQQMVGRGLRLYPGKLFCVVLDVTGVTGRHKLATLVSLSGASSPEDIPDDLLMYEDDEVSAPAVDDLSTPLPPEEPEATEYADGDVTHSFVDLFGESHSAWLRTPGGRWFVPAGNQGFVFLVPAMSREADRWDVRWTTYANGHEGLIQADMEIGYAMAAGDAFVAERPMWQAERDAPWRKEKACRSSRTRGDIHDDQMIAKAASLFDPRSL